MSQQEMSYQELADKVAELTLTVARLRAENMALSVRLPFTNRYRVVTEYLREPVILRGQRITQICYSVPD